ncbi:hypothetical protein AC579_6611 [Pseudocercospora musae]|uniref:Aminotransferase class V domain-containing protein n=1 Tax=Pseudocercospora musae TaxID=113226 RepID=A0A139I6J2_9PEZI|nr:hypothetical protein AC579_6611 [Pseudocercospora musae]
MANDHQTFTAFGGTPIELLIAERDSRSPIEDSMDLLRLLEYPQMLGKTYLDHAGTTPWAKSLINTYAASMADTLYGNPHSEHKPSRDADDRVERTRRKALEFFNADPDDFELIFTPNATGAIKLVHDCFRDYSSDPDGRSWWYGYHKDSHTSVVGVREGTRNHRCYRNDREVDLWIEARGLGGAAAHEVGLFAYPGQSNMTGRRYPLDWPVRIRNRVKAEVYTLLDAAALASTAQIDLSDATRAPDLIAVSFYKIFGMPNLGALLVRKSSPVVEILKRRKFFSGGTVDMVIVVNDAWVDRKSPLHSRLEDGTLPFTSIFALDIAIDIHKKLYGPTPMKYISMHTSRLIKKLYDELTSLRHTNGVPVVKIYKDLTSIFGESHLQGATIAFNVQKSIGGLVSYMDVEREANEKDIYVRSGSLCNPGGFATYLNWSPKELKEAWNWGHKCSEPEPEFQGKPLGVVRASLGAMSNETDLETFVKFLRETYVDRVYSSGGPMHEVGVVAEPPKSRGRDVTAAVFKVEERRTLSREAAFVKDGLLQPPKVDEIIRVDERSVDKEKSMSLKSSGSRIRRVRRSIMGVLRAH